MRFVLVVATWSNFRSIALKSHAEILFEVLKGGASFYNLSRKKETLDLKFRSRNFQIFSHISFFQSFR